MKEHARGALVMEVSALEEETILSRLEELVHTLGIRIRYEQIKKEGSFYPGGLCRVKGDTFLIVNARAALEDKIQTIVRAVIRFDLSGIFIRPALRELLDNYSDDGTQ